MDAGTTRRDAPLAHNASRRGKASADAPFCLDRDRHAQPLRARGCRAGREALTEWALQGADASLIEPIAPDDDIPLLVKARHSIFYETQLEYMLHEREVEHIVLVGQVTEQCILYSALDGYIRHFGVTIPRDAVAHIHPDLADAALKMMEINMRAEITDAASALGSMCSDTSTG